MTAETLIGRDDFRRLANLALKSSEADHTFVSLHDVSSGTTRFANNQIVQNLNQHRVTLSVTVAFGRRHGTATATDFGEESIRDMVKRAAAAARVSPEDPEYVPPLGPQQYASLPTTNEATVQAGPERRIVLAGDAIAFCRREGVTAAGIVASGVAAVGVAANTGLFAYEQRTDAKFSLTAIAGEASGWSANVHRSIERLDVTNRTEIAIRKAQQGKSPKELQPGRYMVILEPSAVAGLIGYMIWMMDAKAYYKQTSPFTGKLGEPLIDSRFTLLNALHDPELLANGFNSEGLPGGELAWIDGGVLKQLRYDRYTAQEHRVAPTPSFDAPHLSAQAAGATTLGDPARSVAELIATTERALLVTNFWYIREVNPTDLTLTGMTRDGIFLIEDGRIATPVVNFRWHESPLHALNRVEAFTAPADAVSNENWKMRLPALKIRDFHFTSVTRF